MKKNLLTTASLTKLKTREVEIGDGFVVIKQMTAAYAMSLRNKEGDEIDTFQLVADMVVEPVLTVEDVGNMNIADVTKIANAILDFNGIGASAVAKAEAELKNAPTEGSTIS